MNQNLFTSIKYLGLLFISCTILSCERYEGEPCGVKDSYFYLTESEKKLWPLTETDSFVLVSNKGERVVYTNGRKRTDFYFENFSSSPECSWRHYYEFNLYLYYAQVQNSTPCSAKINKQNSHLIIFPTTNDSQYFSIPFSYFTPTNYKHYVQTNKGLINCLAYGDSLYYSQTEGIIKVVENDSTFWVREF